MTALGRSFIADVVRTCFDALQDLGIKKRKNKIGTWDLGDGFHGWVGLNTATRFGHGTMAVNPFVGLRYDPVHRLVAEVNGTKYERYSPPTVSRFTGDLFRDGAFMGFEFVKGRETMPIALALRNCWRISGVRTPRVMPRWRRCGIGFRWTVPGTTQASDYWRRSISWVIWTVCIERSRGGWRMGEE